MDAIVYDKVGKEAAKVRDALYGIYPQETITDAAIASFDDGADGLPVQKLVANIEPVQAGSGDPSPDNVRPISGRTGANVTRTGKNLFDPQIFADNGGSLQADGSYYFASPNDLYGKYLWDNVNGYDGQLSLTWIKKDDLSATSATAYPVVYYSDGTFANVPVSLSTQNFSTATFITSANKVVDHITCSYGTNKPGWYKLQIELGSSATAFEEYQGTTISVTFPETIYGGKDDITTGSADSTRYLHTYSVGGGLSYNGTKALSSRFSIPVGVNVIWIGTEISNMFSPNWNVMGHNDNTSPYIFAVYHNSIYFTLPAEINTVEGARAWFNEHAPQFLLYRAEPQTLLHDTQTLDTLYGTNNIWADTGNIKKLTYRADLGKYIDSHITAAVANALNA